MAEQLSTEKHQMILDAAQRRFARYGLSKVTMDEIAQDLGMGKASLYYYFPTKESIFCAVVAREQDKFIEQMKLLLDQNLSAADMLRNYIEQRFVCLRELLNLNAINLNAFYQMKPLFGDLYSKLADHELGFVRQILEFGQQNGEFALEDCGRTASVLQHMLRGLRFSYLKDQSDFNTEMYDQLIQETHHMMDIILNGIENHNLRLASKG